MTCPLVDDQAIEAFDFAKPCKDCGETATAFVQQSHSTDGCWSPGSFRCGPCLDLHLRDYAQWLIDGQGQRCAINRELIIGGLDENTRVMPI